MDFKKDENLIEDLQNWMTNYKIDLKTDIEEFDKLLKKCEKLDTRIKKRNVVVDTTIKNKSK